MKETNNERYDHKKKGEGSKTIKEYQGVKIQNKISLPKAANEQFE
jgi:hypothetical protein